MSRPLKMGDVAKLLEHGFSVTSTLPPINEGQLIGYLKNLAEDAAARAKFLRHVRGLEEVLYVFRDAPMGREEA